VGGSNLSVVFNAGLISDEFYAGHPVSGASDPDFRIWTEPSGIGPYVPLQKARVAALGAIDALKAFAPTPRSKTGQMFAVVGYAELFLGEAMCSGIPLGYLSAAGPVLGTPLSTSDLLVQAVAQFDSAITYASDSARILNLARVGRGRALLDNGKFADAAAAVAAVPTNYAFNAEFTPNVATQQNAIFNYSVGSSAGLMSVSDREGTNGLDYRSANDPRVATVFARKGNDGVSDIYVLKSVTSAGTPILVASGIEARLIEAEAKLQAGDASGSLASLNSLRASVSLSATLAPLALQPDTKSRVDQLFRERAFWLFASGHRQGDLRRLVRQYGRPPESVFPTGQARTSVFYGPMVVFVPDGTQINNPAYKACANVSS
jgi:hypothetical protein